MVGYPIIMQSFKKISQDTLPHYFGPKTGVRWPIFGQLGPHLHVYVCFVFSWYPIIMPNFKSFEGFPQIQGWTNVLLLRAHLIPKVLFKKTAHLIVPYDHVKPTKQLLKVSLDR